MEAADRQSDSRQEPNGGDSNPANGGDVMNLPEKLERCREFAKTTGYSLSVGSNVRKYGGPPPDGSERPRNAEIFLGRLPTTLFEDELVPALETYGKIWEVRILLAEKSEFGRGFAFATFYTPQIANTVVRTLTNKPIPGYPGKNFSISLSKPHSLVMIRNLPKHRTRATLMKDFEGFFEGILGVNIWGVEGKPPVLMAALEFGSERAAAGALGQILAGEVQPYKYKMDAYYSTCDHDDNMHIVVLHIRNLPENASEEDLANHFSQYPAFERARIVNKFAFIHFKDHQSAEKALQEQYGALFMGRPLEMAWARTKTYVPTPPPPLAVSKKSEERLYAYANSSGKRRAPVGGGSRSHDHRAEPYPRDGPPRRRPGPSSPGPYRSRPQGQGRRDSPPPPYYNSPQANRRALPSFEGPSSRSNGYGGSEYRGGDDRMSRGRPEADRGYPSRQPPNSRDRDDAYGGPSQSAPYRFNSAPVLPSLNFPPQRAEPTYNFNQWQGSPPHQPSRGGSYGYGQADYNLPALMAASAVPGYGFNAMASLQAPVSRSSGGSYDQSPAIPPQAYGQYQAPQSMMGRSDGYSGRNSDSPGHAYDQPSSRGKMQRQTNGSRAGNYAGVQARQNGWEG